MKPVLVIAGAARDLEQGRDFYDLQQIGIGETFLRSLLSDIQRLERLIGIHPIHFGLFRVLAERSLSEFIPRLQTRRLMFMPCLICAVTPF